MTAATTAESTIRKAFVLAMVVYVMVWMGVAAFLHRVFGIDAAAIILLTIMAVPAVVALRLLRRWSEAKTREFSYLALLLAVVIAGSCGIVWRLYEDGFHTQHAKDLQFYELARLAHAEKTFHNVEFFTTRYKGRYTIDGSVPTRIDYERLQALCEQYGFTFYAKNVVVMNDDMKAEP